jgi:hypothetical protein
MIGVLDALSGWERTDLYLVAHLDLPHAAARDAVEKLVELICFLLDPRRHSRGCVDISEGRLHWQDHDGLVVLSF